MVRAARKVWGALLVFGYASPVAAAELAWTSPPECERAQTVESGVEGLTGRPLASVDELNFRVAVTASGDGWHLRLSTVSGGGQAPSERGFTGKTCVEVTDAATVAIAMAIRSAEVSPEPAAAPSPEPSPTTETAAAPAPRPDVSRVPPPVRTLTAVVGVAAGVDTAALPTTAFGFGASAGARFRGLRAELQGWFFPPRTTELALDKSGRFDLLAGAALVCVDRDVSRVTALGCAGFELGQMSGEGRAVSEPRLGSALWQAARVELGAAAPMGPALRLAARLGIVAPLSRPEFQVGGVNVHRPAAITLRASIGAEFLP